MHEIRFDAAHLPSPLVVLAETLSGESAALVARAGLIAPLLVCDENTYRALGAQLAAKLAPSGTRTLILPGVPRPDDTTMQRILAEAPASLIAVGSGTINDLCKYASYRAGIPYGVFPTAPSMNGYLSANASWFDAGLKVSKPAHLPRAVLCDMSVIAAAPLRLRQSGFGDAICRSTAQADWLLSHLVFGTPYNDAPFALLAPLEARMLQAAPGIRAGEPESVAWLLRNLLASGWGMTLAGGSQPASGAEHLVAHAMGLLFPELAHRAYHGEQIAVTTLTIAALQHSLLSQPLTLPPCPAYTTTILHTLPAFMQPLAQAAACEKYAFYAQETSLREHLTQHDADFRRQIARVTRPALELRAALDAVGAPTHPEMLGWNAHAYEEALRHARFLRNRITFLDMMRFE